MLPDIIAYLYAVGTYWVIVVTTASPFVLDEFFKRIWPRFRIWLEKAISPKTRRKWEIAIMIAGFVVANFLAFEDEHTARKLAEQKVTQVPTSSEELKNLEADLEQERADAAAKIKQQEEEIESLKRQAAPLSLRERIKECLKEIDPSILTNLEEGTTDFSGEMSLDDIKALTKLASGDVDHKYITQVTVGTDTDITPNGMSKHLSFTLNKELLDSTPPSSPPDK